MNFSSVDDVGRKSEFVEIDRLSGGVSNPSAVLVFRNPLIPSRSC